MTASEALKPERTPFASRAAVGVALLAWGVLLALVLRHTVFVTNDSLNNYAHVWYVSEHFWHGHGIPLHMPVLGHGESVAFPYGFIPWFSAALVHPLLGEWTVTLWLVAGGVLVIAATFWALPELRRGMWPAAVLANPVLVEGVILGQLPFMWAAAMLFVAIGCYRRQRWLLAPLFAGLAQATHAPVLLPITGVLVLFELWRTPANRRPLLTAYGASLVIALPAVVMVLVSPSVEDTSLAVQAANLVTTTGLRFFLFAIPLGLVWLQARGYNPLPLFAVLVAGNLVIVPLHHSEFAWGALTRGEDRSMLPFLHSRSFEPDATYRILRVADGKVGMYQLLRAGGRLDSEFFPESINRRSWPDAAAYAAFLQRRDVDYVIVYNAYDRRYKTNEHELLDDLLGRGAGGVCAELVGTGSRDIGFQPAVDLIMGEGLLEGNFYSVYRIRREGCP
jgi:hypothetical protein